MIRYALICQQGHQFESWFQDSAAYDKQAKRGLISCPHCGSAKVEKAIMAPRLSATAKKRSRTIEARKMHYGEAEHRSIYGVASTEEAKELSEEGIEFHPLPPLPDERN
jgi:hypothetical protein